MSFLLRAALVIGALSYLAAHRDGAGLPGRPAAVSPEAALAVAWDALPADLRDRAAREGATALARQWAGAAPASRDTLAAADRRPAWRGSDPR